MYTARIALLALVVASSSIVVGSACSDDPVSPSSSSASGRYTGAFTGENDVAGTMSVTLTEGAGTASPSTLRPLAVTRYVVTGSLTVNVAGIGPVTLTGTVDTSTGKIDFSGGAAGGAITFTGTLANNVMSGKYTSPWGRGEFSLASEALGGLRTFCGTFDGALVGRWSLYTAGGLAGGVFASFNGESGVLVGTASGDRVALRVPPSGSANGTIVGSKATGDWSTGAGPAGRFEVSEEQCRGLTPPRVAPPVDGGTDGGEGGVDGGPLQPLQEIFTITNHSINALAVKDGLVHVMVQSIPNELWVLRNDGTQKVKIHSGTVADVASTSKNVYWTSLSTVESMGVLGNPTPTTLMSTLDRATYVVTDDTDLFFLEDGANQIRRLSHGGVAGPTVTGQVFSRDLALDATHVYWASNDPAGRAVRRATKALGTSETVIDAPDFGGVDWQASHVAVEGNELFALVGPGTQGGVTRIVRRAKDGTGAVTTAMTDSNGPLIDLTADGSHLYVSTWDPNGAAGKKGHVLRVPRTNLQATPDSLFETDEIPKLLRLDGTNVYWATLRSVWRKTK